MRLNRVLLLAASINMTMLATVFTISCSGSDGKDGKDGCTVAANSDGGYDVMCNGAKLGSLESGTQGDAGAPGENCTVAQSGAGYKITCDGEEVTLNGCSSKVGATETLIDCGSSKVGLCGSTTVVVFDPATSECDDSGAIVSKIEKCDDFEDTDIGANLNDGEYCGYASATATETSVLDTQCEDGTQPNKDKWNDEYCEVKAKGAKSTKSSEVCENGDKINEDEYAYEYCGYETLDYSASSVKPIKKKMDGVCDQGGKGPNSDWFNAGYCAVLYEDRDSAHTHIGVAFNGETVVAGNKGKTTYRKIPTTGDCAGVELNKNYWKNEYCGWEEDPENQNKDYAKKKLVGICDDGKTPNAPNWDNEYCTILYADKDKDGQAGPKSGYSTLSKTLCGTTPMNTITTTGNTKGVWRWEYCGIASEAADDPTIVTTMCDDGSKPNESLWKNEYCSVKYADRTKLDRDGAKKGSTSVSAERCGTGAELNKNEWRWEYCGYASKAAYDARTSDDPKKTVLTIMCDDGSKPNESSWAEQYCTVTFANKDSAHTRAGAQVSFDGGASATISAGAKGKTTMSSTTCGDGQQLNYWDWKSEYCGMGTGTSPSATTGIMTGYCDDGGKPRENWNASGTGDTYCAVKYEDRLTNRTTISGVFCGGTSLNAGIWDATTLSWKTGENDGWINQYCVTVVTTPTAVICPGGWKGKTASVETNSDYRDVCDPIN